MENTLTKKLPPMLTGNDLEAALTIAPEYDPDIITQDPATRLMALNQLYKVFVPTRMAKEIYTRMYLSLLRSLQKKESKLAIQQYMENHKAIRQQQYSGIIGGSDSFTIIGTSGIGKSSAITRAIQLLIAEEVIEIKRPYSKIIPCVLVMYSIPYRSIPESMIPLISASVILLGLGLLTLVMEQALLL